MPKLSLAVCLYREREFLERLLDRSVRCYDDLVVVHDGPDADDVRALVESRDGRFFERPRQFQQEPHWPFAWEQARHDWILRWDADEFPSEDLRRWLQAFRTQPEPLNDISGYTCIWPLWDGRRARTKRWPRRVCLVHRQRVRYFGIVHQGPIADGRFASLTLVLHHQPALKNYGIRYTLARPKVRRWQRETGRSLLGMPTDLACWRWHDPNWPKKFEEIRRRPLWTATKRLIFSPIGNALEMIHCGEIPRPSMLTFFPLQHFLTCLSYVRARAEQRRQGQYSPKT